MSSDFDSMTWSRKDLFWPMFAHVVLLGFLVALLIWRVVNQSHGANWPIPLGGAMLLTTSLFTLTRKAAISIHGDTIQYIVSPWFGFTQQINRGLIKKVERVIVDGKIVRYVAHRRGGNVVAWPPAPWLSESIQVQALDNFMQRNFAGLLHTSITEESDK